MKEAAYDVTVTDETMTDETMTDATIQDESTAGDTIKDETIIDGLFAGEESSLLLLQKKYSKYILYIANNILGDMHQAEECLNDVCHAIWKTIPPNCPERLSAYIGKITRNLALKKYNQEHALKRGCGQLTIALEEISETVGRNDQTAEDNVLRKAISDFLYSLPEKKRRIFLRRYWYLSPISDIARDFSMSESNVKVTLLRIRKSFKRFLVKEGILAEGKGEKDV